MESIVKRNVRLLAEKYEHSVSYPPQGLKISSTLNELCISPQSKDILLVEYNSSSERETVYVSTQGIYDIVLQILQRRNAHSVKMKSNHILNIEKWVSDEGKNALKDFNNLKQELKNSNPSNRIMFGNRIEAEYYSGVIILQDVMNEYVSTIINL